MSSGTSSISPEERRARVAELKAAGRFAEALELQREAVRLNPASSVAEHNLAATLGDLGRMEEAAETAARALAKGSQAPETWLVYARALQGSGRDVDAEAAFLQAIELRPAYAEAHRDLAQLRWMQSADWKVATVEIDRAIAAHPDDGALRLHRARILLSAGRPEDAAETLAPLAAVAVPEVQLLLAQAAAARQQPQVQLSHAMRAFELGNRHPTLARPLIEALMNAGHVAQAAGLAEQVVRALPDDQGALALLLTAWRLAGDRRGEILYRDEALIGTAMIAAPPGWRDLPAYLADLETALRRRHRMRTHPFEQSVRHGSQTTENLTETGDPVIEALFTTMDSVIRAHLHAIGTGTDPVRARNRGGYRIVGAWSILLKPGGYHVDHVHPEGWYSTALHISLPHAMDAGHQGWLAFGRPGIPLPRPLPPIRHVRPRAGQLVMFPSCFWHGTESFTSGTDRLTVAFDMVPDQTDSPARARFSSR